MNRQERIVEACINAMYKASKPSISWAQIKKKYGGKKTTFYDKHYLPEEKYEKIKAKYEAKLDSFYKRKLPMFLLDFAPTCVKRK